MIVSIFLVSKIEKDSIKECSLIEDTDDILYSTKIRYVGKQSLEPYLFSFIDNSSFFIKQLFETHIYLTNSIEKLIHSKIVHYDIKENNILYDNNQYLPIIIDFGLSFRIDLLDTDVRYENAFYVFVSTCTWWCLEIAIISFIVCKEYNPESASASSSWMNDSIPISYLLNIVEDYYSNNVNMILISTYWKKEVDISKKKWRDFTKSLHLRTTESHFFETKSLFFARSLELRTGLLLLVFRREINYYYYCLYG